MRNRIRPYAWGSRTAIAELTGAPSPSAHPQAELWMGAHPDDPSQLLRDGDEISLLDAVRDNPRGMLGDAVTEAFEGRFPFLLKVLAAAEPLSLQAHPSAELARRGFDAEEAAGVARSDPNRNYKDPWPKPELICALTDLRALCGFADPAHTVAVLSELAVPELDHYSGLLAGQLDSEGTRALFSTLVTIPQSVVAQLLDAVLAACVDKVREGTSPYVENYRTALELAERYPGDAGVLASLMMNQITLKPGEALYLPPGNMHAYLAGTGVEIMGNSDNVLRGGLTPKHVDVPELMRVLDFTPGPVNVLGGEGSDGETVYRTSSSEFRLSRLTVDDAPVPIDYLGPQIVLVIEGSARFEDANGQQIEARRGQSVWIAASDAGVQVTGPAVLFRATDGL